MNQPMTIGAVAAHFGRPPWQVRRLFERGILPPAAHVGPYRVIDADDLPTVETALRSAGYLPPEPRHEADGRGVANG